MPHPFWILDARPNPAWSNEAVTALWRKLEKRVGHKRMPLQKGRGKLVEYGSPWGMREETPAAG